ncbi:MAG TPA: hypothetical protein VF070_13270 [Streptosporangiaceae bacterium]
MRSAGASARPYGRFHDGPDADHAYPGTALYGRVCVRLGRDRTEDLLDHMRRQITEHGDEADLADLEAAQRELAERRSRKGGRPRRTG